MLTTFRTVFRRFSTAAACLPHVNCWRCEKLLDCEREKFFCASCRIIQPPVKCVNYFQYLDQPLSFDVDQPSLAAYFKNLQRQLHPDRFTNRSPDEQNYSAQQASLVNNAYSTLSNPLSRALYLLKLHGKPLTESEGSSTDPELLTEMLERNEQLADCQSLDDVKKIGEETKKTLDQLKTELSAAFREKDIDMAKAIVIRMKFFVSLEQKVHSRLGLG